MRGKRESAPTGRELPAGDIIKKIGIIALIVLAGAILTVLILGFVLRGNGKVFPNVMVGSINLGELSREEATEQLKTESEKIFSQKLLTIKLPDRAVTFRPENTKVRYKSDLVMDKAMEVGRTGGPVTALLSWLRCKKTPTAVDCTEAVELDEEYVRTVAEGVSRDVESILRQTKTEYDEQENTLVITMGTARRHLDPEAMVQLVNQAYEESEFRNSTLDYDVTMYDKLDLRPFWEEHCTPMQNAEYNSETHELIRESEGFGFDLEKTQELVDKAEEGQVLTIKLEKMIPEVTIEDIRGELFPDKLAAYDSDHTNQPARTQNLVLACKAIHGTILNPGETFSFNKIVGERSAAKGYQSAIVYTTGGKSEPELGGGVCQVASTIYMCALLSDMKIVERTEHMYAVTYVPMGMDATIYWGNLDFKFKNSMETPILITASVSGGQVHIAFYGKDTRTEFVKMTYTTISTTPWEEVEKVDETKDASFREVTETPYTGYKVQTYKNYYDKAGNLLRTEKCAFSNYKKRDKLITVGKKEEEVPAAASQTETQPAEQQKPTEASVQQTDPVPQAAEQPLPDTQTVPPAEQTAPVAEQTAPVEQTAPAEQAAPAESSAAQTE